MIHAAVLLSPCDVVRTVIELVSVQQRHLTSFLPALLFLLQQLLRLFQHQKFLMPLLLRLKCLTKMAGTLKLISDHGSSGN